MNFPRRTTKKNTRLEQKAGGSDQGAGHDQGQALPRGADAEELESVGTDQRETAAGSRSRSGTPTDERNGAGAGKRTHGAGKDHHGAGRGADRSGEQMRKNLHGVEHHREPIRGTTCTPIRCGRDRGSRIPENWKNAKRQQHRRKTKRVMHETQEKQEIHKIFIIYCQHRTQVI